MVGAVVIFSIYLGARDDPNPYNNRKVWKDAKLGNKWAQLCVLYSIFFGIYLALFFYCLI
jgi:hypothetical protein